MLSLSMCYIPPPVDAVVLSDLFSSKFVALSVERDAVLWELQEKGGFDYRTEQSMVDCTP